MSVLIAIQISQSLRKLNLNGEANFAQNLTVKKELEFLCYIEVPVDQNWKKFAKQKKIDKHTTDLYILNTSSP